MSCFSVSYSVLHPFAMDVIKDQMSFPNDEDSSIPAFPPAFTDWGYGITNIEIDGGEKPLPTSVSMMWISILEQKCYAARKEIDTRRLGDLMRETDGKGSFRYDQMVIGIAPYGSLAIWIRGESKSELLCHIPAQQITEHNKDLDDYLDGCPLEQHCKEWIESEGLSDHPIIHSKTVFDNYMRQYQYRYVGLEEYFDGEAWQQYDEEDEYYDDLDLDSIEDQRFDGTHDQIRDGGLMKYHKAGCPKRIAVRWHEGRHDFSAYYWLDEDAVPQTFSRFFLMNIEGRIEILLRIDTRANRYGIAMKGDFVQQPQALPTEAYQLLVFRNGLELFRSENYAQDDGAWNW